jgi:hypothetical protein
MKDTLWPRGPSVSVDAFSPEWVAQLTPTPTPTTEQEGYEHQISAISGELTRLKDHVAEKLYKNKYHKEEISYDDVSYIETELRRIQRDLT